MNPHFFFPESYFNEGFLLMEDYDLVKGNIVPDRKPAKLKMGKKLVCRFCKKSQPEVTFGDDAHIIPESVGNHHWVSDFECDDCNLKFGTTYDDHFARFLGINRTLSNVKGKRGVPTFKSSDKKLRAEKENIFGIRESISVTNTDADSDAVVLNLFTGKGSLESFKQPYRPLWVYKAMLKMALSFLDQSEMANYETALEFLMTENLDQKLGKLCHCRCYLMPVGFGIKDPYVLLFRKKQAVKRLPTHLFVLVAQNTLYEIFIPLNIKDQHLYNGELFSALWCPPIFAKPEDARITPVRHFDFDLSSSELRTDDREVLQFGADPGDLQKLVRIDPLTGKESPFDGKDHGVKKLILVPPGTMIDISQLGKF